MGSSLAPRVLGYLADAAITAGMVLKQGTDFKHVAKCSAATDKTFGIALNTATTAEDAVEVAVDGGCKGLAGGTIATGDLLTSDANGKLVASTVENDRMVGIALQSAVSGDYFDMKVDISVG